MPYFGSSYSGPKETSYLFVDGAYLRGAIQSYGETCFGTPDLPVDFSLLAPGFTKVFYYDCLVPQKPQEPEENYRLRLSIQETHFKKLRLLRGWHLIEGVVKRTGKRARQKEIDILIAVDMLTHTYRRNMHRVAFIAGDQDFRPLVEAIVREGMFIELWYEASSASTELVHTADAHRVLDGYVIHSILDKQFQKAYPLPHRLSQPGRALGESVLVSTARTSDDLPVELYEGNAGFLIVQPDLLNDGYFLHMSHTDQIFLKKVHAMTYGTSTWENAV